MESILSISSASPQSPSWLLSRIIFVINAVFLFFAQNIEAEVAAQSMTSLRQRNNHLNISLLLDNLLRGYDNSVRPNFGGPPAEVEVDIMVRSMGPISEVDMTYSMDCYFRQSWVDRRLAFESEKETLALSITMLQRIWKPDTYFYNGKQSYLHTITTPNKFVRLFRDGRVLYSSRLTIKAGCPMNLEDFPMDTQHCPLKFGSFGYTTNDVLYRWNQRRTVAIAEDMKLSQFDLIATPSANQTDVLLSGTTGKYSMLFVSFHLQRHMGNFLIQVYGPCVLLVVLSWVSFWLNREATADRVSLGITTVLTMTFLGLEARTDLPKVPYPTALDFFVFLSFAFIFATIIQFAIVHYFTKCGSGECYFNLDFSSESSSEEEEWQESCITSCPTLVGSGDLRPMEIIPLSEYHVPSGLAPTAHYSATTSPCSAAACFSCTRKQRGLLARISPPYSEAFRSPDPMAPWTEASKRSLGAIDSSRFAKTGRHASITPSGLPGQGAIPTSLPAPISLRSMRIRRNHRRRKTPRFNSVSKIDRVSRVVFPFCFLTINLFYWYSYLSHSKRMSRGAQTL